MLDDLTPFFAHGSAVVWGLVSGRGHLDAPAQIIADGAVLTTDYTLTCEASKFGKARYGDQIRVGGVLFEVRETRPIDDGRIVEIALTKV